MTANGAMRAAADIPELSRPLDDFSQDELRQIPVLEPGAPLEEGTVYLDLCHRERGTFSGHGRVEVGSDHWYASKSDVPDPFWTRLVGAQPASGDRDQSGGGGEERPPTPDDAPSA